MRRRMLQVVTLAVAVAVAIGAGTLVRRHLDGPDPIATVRAATAAYASGDCSALRKVTVDPDTVDCAAVDSVRDAYRAEGLEPATFRYDVVARDGDDATVRIWYDRGKNAEQELVQVRKRDGSWKVFPAPLGG